ncbi:MAG: glutaredoxin family protein [Planctomycetes bacterium]|nr:glutaredoxin family protein [Planctomycetota bacterium]
MHSDRPVEALLFTRAGCHLCDQAKATLEQAGLRVSEVDVDQAPELVRRFGNCVPVVVIDGRPRFRGHVDPVLLRRILRARA